MAKEYFWQPPKELGMSGGGSRELRYQVGGYFTEAEIRAAWNAEEGMGYFKESFGDDFDKYFAYIEDQQNLIDQGKLPELITNWERIVESGVIYNYIEQLRRGQITVEQYDRLVANQTNTGWLAYRENPEYQALIERHEIPVIFQNDDGDLFEFNGSNYTKTFKVDDHPGIADYAGALITTVVTAAATWGVANGSIGKVLTDFFTGTLGMSSGAASAATSSLVSSGITGVLGGEVTVEGVLVNALGAGIGAEVAGLAGLSGAAGSALSSAVNEAVVSGILDGELNFEDLLTAGALGGATAVGSDLFTALVKGQDFTFGGLIDEDSKLWGFFNDDGGFIDDVRGGFDEFVTKYIDGGEWFTTLDETDEFKDFTVNGDDTVTGTRWDGTTVEFDDWESFASSVFSTNKLIDNPIWDFISKNLTGQQAEEFYKRVVDWMNSSGGAENDTGGTITSNGQDDSTDPNDFDCSSVNRQQVAGATTGTECGPCIDGYQPDVDGVCVEGVTEQCPEGQVWNDITLQCEDEVFFEEGQPCNTEDGTQGTFNANGECVVPDGTGDGTGEDDGDGTGEGQCQDPNRLVNQNGECTDSCRSGYELDTDQDICVASGPGPSPNDCSAGAPTAEEYGGFTFAFSSALREWQNRCGETTCQDGTPKEDDPNCDGNQPVDGEQCTTDDGEAGSYQDGVCVAFPVTVEPCADPNRAQNPDGSCSDVCNDRYEIDEETGLCVPIYSDVCDNSATVESGCSECADGTFPEDYEDGKCPTDPVNPDNGDNDGDGESDTDCTLVECDAPRPEGEAGVAWDECCNDPVIDVGPDDGGETDCTLVECDSPRPDPEISPDEAAAWDECCTGVQPPPTGGGGGGNGGSGGRRAGNMGNMFDVDPLGSVGDPQLLAANQFPITDFLAQVFKPKNKKPPTNGGGMLT